VAGDLVGEILRKAAKPGPYAPVDLARVDVLLEMRLGQPRPGRPLIRTLLPAR
jgi:hypothetical protein